MRGRRPASAHRSYTRFRVNWGFRDGANASRLLAAVCRRGEISSNAIGTIEIEPTSATFDVASEVAAAFEQKAQRRDKRDPKQRIERISNGPPQQGMTMRHGAV